MALLYNYFLSNEAILQYSSLIVSAPTSMLSIFKSARVESGLDDLDNLGDLGHFLVGRVGLIHKLNYLAGYHMFFRKQCWHLVIKLVDFWSDEFTEIPLV